MADITMTAGTTKRLGIKATGVDGSDQSAQLASGTWSVDQALLQLAAEDAVGLIELAQAGASEGTVTVSVNATDQSGNFFSATSMVTITPASPPPPPPPPAIASVEIVDLGDVPPPAV